MLKSLRNILQSIHQDHLLNVERNEAKGEITLHNQLARETFVYKSAVTRCTNLLRNGLKGLHSVLATTLRAVPFAVISQTISPRCLPHWFYASVPFGIG